MSEVALRMDHVYKKFRKGEIYDSLRDLIPALTGRFFRNSELNAADEREFWALQDICFEVAKGEAFGIIGHNGAGKSTILKILSGIMQPTKGQMVVDGRLTALIEVGAGFHPDLTGRENIYLNGAVLGMSRREVASKLDAIVDFSGLSEFIDTPVKRYSTGMFARLGFSVAAHVNPDVLIVDEVLSVGDYLFQQKCLTRMNEVLRDGKTILFVSHNLGAVSELCQRCLLLDHGKVLTIGDTSDTMRRYMETISAEKQQSPDLAARLSKVELRNRTASTVRFAPGEKTWVDIELECQKRCENVMVALCIWDDNNYYAFGTATDYLGHPPYDLDCGDILRCTFELDLNMVPGTYHVGIYLYRSEVHKHLASWDRSVTFYISAQTKTSVGLVNCDPRVVHQEIVRAGTSLEPPRVARAEREHGVAVKTS